MLCVIQQSAKIFELYSMTNEPSPGPSLGKGGEGAGGPANPAPPTASLRRGAR